MTNNVFEVGALTATDTAAGYDVNNILDRRPFTKWRAASSGTKYITVDHTGANLPVSGIAIIGHNFHTADAAVTVEAYNVVDDWVEIHEFTITKDGSIAGHWDLVEDADEWRIKIVTASVAAEFAIALMGEVTVFPVPPDSPHTDFAEMGIKESGNSKTGNLLGVVNRGSIFTFNLKFSLLLRSWVDAWILGWWWPRFGKTGIPFAYIPDYDYDPEETYLVRATDDYNYQTPKSIATYYDTLEFTLVGLRY